MPLGTLFSLATSPLPRYFWRIGGIITRTQREGSFSLWSLRSTTRFVGAGRLHSRSPFNGTDVSISWQDLSDQCILARVQLDRAVLCHRYRLQRVHSLASPSVVAHSRPAFWFATRHWSKLAKSCMSTQPPRQTGVFGLGLLQYFAPDITMLVH